MLFPDRLSRLADRFYHLISPQLQIDFVQLGLPKWVGVQWWIPVFIWVFAAWLLTGVFANYAPLVGAAFTLFVLSALIRVSQFSQVMTSVYLYLNQGDLSKAKSTLANWAGLPGLLAQEEVCSEQMLFNLAVQKGCERILNQFFALFFWFTVAGLEMVIFHYVVYQSVLKEREQCMSTSLQYAPQTFDANSQEPVSESLLSPRFVLMLLNWIPARLFALTLISKINPADLSLFWQKDLTQKRSNVVYLERLVYSAFKYQTQHEQSVDAIYLWVNWVFTSIVLWLFVTLVFTLFGFL